MKPGHLTPLAPAAVQVVLAAVARGATVLTPTRGAARQLLAAADIAAQAGGATSWRSAAILPWGAWAAAQWNAALVRGAVTEVLLNDTQERALWIGILQQAGADTPQAAALYAALCMRTGRLLAAHNAEAAFAKGFAGAQTTDMETFRRWHRRFLEVCQRESYLPRARLDVQLRELVQQRMVQLDAEYLLYGFVELTPARRQLTEALRTAGAAVTELPVTQDATQPPSLLQYSSRDAELTACAQWARQRLQQAPEQTVAIVVPDLAAVRSDLERELRAAVSPASANVLQPAPLPYEFSSGVPLRSLPMVEHALLLLRWCAGPLPLDDAGTLLRSPHLTLGDTPETGAMLDETALRPRAGLRKQVSLQQAAWLLRAYPAGARCEQLGREAERRLRVRAQTFAYFADEVPALLQLAGWPGQHALDNDESAAVEHWQRALDDVASLDLLGTGATWHAFLQELTARVARASFTPAPRGLPLQVLTPAEAEGTAAHALWFLQAEATHWPQRPAPDALLPLLLQRDAGMPGIAGERDDALAEAHLRQLIGGVQGEVCISWSPAADDDAGRPAPLAERVVLSLGGQVSGAHAPIAEQTETRVETFFDTTPLPPLPSGATHGGVSVLTAQAQCGFRAWAEKRLFATPLEAVEDGLSARERGTDVHAVLEAFWKQVGSQAELKRLRLSVGADGVSERDRRLRACIANVCTAGERQGWDGAYLRVQQQRLFRLVGAWLDYEETRPPFRVTQLEQSVVNVPVGDLRLRMRVDRVDTVLSANDSGAAPLGTVLIDYKTGGASHKDWDGARPDEPQLPAYAVAAAAAAGVGHVDGIAFATVRAGTGNTCFDSVAEAGLLPPPGRRSDKRSYAEHTAEWAGSVTALATAYSSGDAAVDPKIYPATCNTCGQRILCRLDASTLLQVDPDAQDESGVELE